MLTSCPECRVKDLRIKALVAEARRQLLHAHKERTRAREMQGGWQEMVQQRDALLLEVRALRETLYSIQEHGGESALYAAVALVARPEASP